MGKMRNTTYIVATVVIGVAVWQITGRALYYPV
jgi:hypothetical protein